MSDIIDNFTGNEYREDVYTTIFNDNEHPFWIPQFGKTYADPRYHQIRPKSDVGCVEYILSGEGIINVSGKTFIVRAGDTYLLPQGLDVNYYSDFNNPMEKIWVNFKGDYAQTIIKVFGLKSTYVFRNLNSASFIEQMQLDAMCSNSPKIIQTTAELSFLKTIQFLSEHKPIQNLDNLNLIEKIRTYIDLHITDNISLKQVAEFFERSPDHIGRLFKEAYDTTPHQYIINSKITIAASILASTHRSTKSVSEMVGFGYEKDFVKHFKRKYGITPSKYHEKRLQEAIAQENFTKQKIEERLFRNQQ